MTYITEFPDFDADADTANAVAFLLENGFEDASWRNDSCPLFQCDVFVVAMDYADPTKRDESAQEAGRFSLTCEGELMLETDDFADVIAFVDDGKRDFPEYVRVAS